MAFMKEDNFHMTFSVSSEFSFKEKQEKLILYIVNQNREMFRILELVKQYKTLVYSSFNRGFYRVKA